MGDGRTRVGLLASALVASILGSVYWFAGDAAAPVAVPGTTGLSTPPAELRSSWPEHEARQRSDRIETGVPTADAGREVVSIEERAAGARLTVRVVDFEGSPVPGARIELVTGRESRRVGAADAQGRFVAAGLPAGTAAVSATAAGLAPAARQAVQLMGGQESEVVLTLDPLLVLEGIVHTRGQREPVGQSEMRLVPRDALDRPEGRERLALSNAEGRFRFEDVAPGSYVLTGYHARFGRGHYSILRIAAGDRGVVRQDIHLDPVGSISGWVRTTAGDGIAGARVRAVGRDGTDPTPRKVESAATGAFVLSDLAPGLFRLDVEAPGFEPARLERVACGRDHLVVTLEPRVPVHVRVVEARDGSPIEAYRLMVRLVDPSTLQRGRFAGPSRRVSDSAGHACLDDLGAGTYVVEVQAAGFALATSEFFTLAPGGREVELVLALTRGAAVEGRLVAEDGRGVENADLWSEAWLVSPSLPVGVWSPNAVRARSDAEGRYRLEFPVAGRYRLVVLPRDMLPPGRRPSSCEPGTKFWCSPTCASRPGRAWTSRCRTPRA